MKRTCVNHKDAEFICVSKRCQHQCVYVCTLPFDRCRQNHQSCQLMSLSYLQRKSNNFVAKEKQLKMNELKNFYSTSTDLINKIKFLFEASISANRVKQLLDPHGVMSSQQKQIVCNFIEIENKNPQDVSSALLEKQLIKLNMQISNYLTSIKQPKGQIYQKERKKQIQQKKAVGQLKTQSRLKPENLQQISPDKKMNSAIQKSSRISKGPTPVKSQLRQQVTMKHSRVSNLASTSNKAFQQKISSGIKSHVPVGPLFSNITNDIQTIQTFFYQKFLQATLLFRASQNGFSAAKFHQKCDGMKHTLTILITQYDKVIGGYTPLPWKSSGDWHEDPSQSSFIFNLTSGQRFPIQNKAKAIWCSHSYGPSFGYPDLQIADKAFYNNNSCVNFPQFYNNGNYNKGAGSIQLLCGNKSGQFRIKQWEVYQLDFGNQ